MQVLFATTFFVGTPVHITYDSIAIMPVYNTELNTNVIYKVPRIVDVFRG